MEQRKPGTFGGAPSDQEIAIALGTLPPAPVEAPASVADKPAVRWLTDKVRVGSYDLEHPFAIGDVEYRTIGIHRMTVADVDGFLEKLNERRAAGEKSPHWPLYQCNGAAMSDEAWATLDDDDRMKLVEIGSDFLPARFRAAPAATAD